MYASLLLTNRLLRTLSTSLLLLLASSLARAEFIAFPALTFTEHRGVNPAPDVPHRHPPKQSDLEPYLTLFYSAETDRLRFLAEAMVAPERDLERLQVGWMTAPGTTVWLGRYHTPYGYWNSQFHHASYLQTSIQRPGIADFEHDGGVLPTHLSGLLLESDQPYKEGMLGYSLSLGAASQQEPEGTLAPFDLLRPGKGSHKPAAALRLSYQPDVTRPVMAGVFAGYSIIPSAMVNMREIRQTVVGAFLNHEQGKWRWIAELYGVRNDIDRSTGPLRSSFSSANLQGEYTLARGWRLYGRAENTYGERSGAYLVHFSDFTRERYLLGLRYELGPKQALKLELSDVHVAGDSYDQLALQWSAALP